MIELPQIEQDFKRLEKRISAIEDVMHQVYSMPASTVTNNVVATLAANIVRISNMLNSGNKVDAVKEIQKLVSCDLANAYAFITGLENTR
jgi:hypothetical protein